MGCGYHGQLGYRPAQVGHRVVRRADHLPRFPAEMIDGLEYGLGIELFELQLGIYGHGGGIPGYGTMVRHAPETGRTAFWVTTNDQVNPSPSFLEVFEVLGS